MLRRHRPQHDTRRVICTDLPDHNIVITRKAPPRYTNEDWDFNNALKFKVSEEQEKLAERVIAESKRVIDETRDTSESLKKEVDYQLKERAGEIKFLIDELNKQKEEGLLSEESLKSYRKRVLNCIEFLKSKSLAVCQKCIVYRENRLGPDLATDEVDAQLLQELKVIKGCQAMSDKVYGEVQEQIRRLRATLYLLDRDLYNKGKSLKIDETNLLLRETLQDMSIYEGKVPLDQGAFSLEQWKTVTYANIANTAKELNSAAQLRSYIDVLLKQILEDMKTQMERTNEAFERHISEIRQVRDRLEKLHFDTIKHINDINKNIISIEKELAEKEGYVALCQMRLGNRAQRPELELTKDMVHEALLAELNALQCTVEKLNQKHRELKATLRYLLHTQMLQEEELNIKANSLKIDEVDCMTTRLVLHYDTL